MMQVTLDSNNVEWSEDAARMFAPIFEDDPTGGVENLKAQVISGNASLSRVTHGAELVGYFSLRIDQLAAGDELVIVAASGHMPGLNLYSIFLPVIERQAREAGCEWVRVHASRKGMFKRLALSGYAFSEWVLRKKL